MDLEEVLQLQQDACARQMAWDEEYNSGAEGCGVLWDGIFCWPRSKVNISVYSQCPVYLAGFDFRGFAHNECTEEGWTVSSRNQTLVHQECAFNLTDPEEGGSPNAIIFPWLPVIKAISLVGYGVSLVTLLLAFCILFFSKRLRCQRNMLHLHLFVSFIMRAVLVLLKDYLFVGDVGFANNVYTIHGRVAYVREVHTWECKVFTVLWQYFLLANYSWILMEGIYLHNLIFRALFSDTSSIRTHVLLGWTLPVFCILPWAVVRRLYEDLYCWTTHTNSTVFLIIRVPMVTSCVINLFLFINITRVLLSKLSTTASQQLDRRVSRYRKWAKSTLVLMPLYGVHYALFLSLSYVNDPYVELAWLLLDHSFSCTQGFFVGILYCLLNGDVISELRAWWHRLKSWYTGEDALSMSTWRKASHTRSVALAVQVTKC